jgi:hypothetical protein
MNIIKANFIFMTRSIVLLSLLIAACSTVSVYSPEAYKQAVDLKIESLNRMSFATTSYDDYEAEVNFLKTELNKAYEFAKGRPDNEISTQQWETLIDEDRNLLGGFLKRWKDENSLSQMFVDEMQLIVSDAFDTIIGLESGKINPAELK